MKGQYIGSGVYQDCSYDYMLDLVECNGLVDGWSGVESFVGFISRLNASFVVLVEGAGDASEP